MTHKVKDTLETKQDRYSATDVLVSNKTALSEGSLYLFPGDHYHSTILKLASGFSGIMYPNGTHTKSDDRLKFNEKYITNVSETLLKLKPQSYMKKNELDGDEKDAVFEIGLIAQEIWYDAPELRPLIIHSGSPDDAILSKSDDPTVDPDYPSWGPEPAAVNYTGFIPYLIRGFQEHNAVIESQKVEIFGLKKENAGLKARVDSLESQIAMLMKAVGLVDSGNVESV